MKAIQRTTVSQVEKLINQDHVLIFDIRDPHSYRCGHIEGAIHLGDHNIKTVLKKFNKNLTLIVYCYHGVSSLEITQLLSDFGFKSAYSMDGGYEAWLQQSRTSKRFHSDIVEWMNANGFDSADLEKRNPKGDTALLYAARKGLSAYVFELLEHGALKNQRNRDGDGAVMLACCGGDQATLDILIEEDADLDAQNIKGLTALMCASSSGSLDMVKRLIVGGADYEKKTLDGYTALDLAATLPIRSYLSRCVSSQVDNSLVDRLSVAG